MDRQRGGQIGENIALSALQKQGFVLLERNYRAGRCEIDLIMLDADTVVFVEVKARSSMQFGMGREAVTIGKQQHIIRAALAYMQQNDLFNSLVRFDVVEVDLNTFMSTHIPNAFHA